MFLERKDGPALTVVASNLDSATDRGGRWGRCNRLHDAMPDAGSQPQSRPATAP